MLQPSSQQQSLPEDVAGVIKEFCNPEELRTLRGIGRDSWTGEYRQPVVSKLTNELLERICIRKLHTGGKYMLEGKGVLSDDGGEHELQQKIAESVRRECKDFATKIEFTNLWRPKPPLSDLLSSEMYWDSLQKAAELIQGCEAGKLKLKRLVVSG